MKTMNIKICEYWARDKQIKELEKLTGFNVLTPKRLASLTKKLDKSVKRASPGETFVLDSLTALTGRESIK